MSEQELPTTSVPFTDLDPKEHRVTYMIRVVGVPPRTKKKEKDKCLHREHKKRCNQETQGQRCCVCGTPTCKEHDVLPSKSCFLHYGYGFLRPCCFCPTCATLPQDVQLSTYTFLQQLNEQQ